MYSYVMQSGSADWPKLSVVIKWSVTPRVRRGLKHGHWLLLMVS